MNFFGSQTVKNDITDAKVKSSVSSELNTDTSATIRLGFFTIIIGFGLIIVWAAFAPLDEGVPANATVVINNKRKNIQHLSGGVIRKVFVHEGQRVKYGDILLELDAAVTLASYESIRQNFLSQKAIESRLVAEIENLPQLKFTDDLLRLKNDDNVKKLLYTQTKLFESRRSAFRSEILAIDESISAFEETLAGTKLQSKYRNIQFEKLSEQLKNNSLLSMDGFVSKNQLLQIEQSQAELSSILAELNANKSHTEKQISELKFRKTQRQMESIKEITTQLIEVRLDMQAGKEKLNAVKSELDRTQIKAPVSGQVLGLTLASLGGVVTPGQKLMDIVPDGESLVLDAKVPTHVIDSVYEGGQVFIRFSTFAHTPQLVVEGVIDSLSSDVITDQSSQMAFTYYLARVSLTPEGIKQLDGKNLQPGMNAEILIKTGERSLLTYLLHPLSKRITSAMKEE